MSRNSGHIRSRLRKELFAILPVWLYFFAMFSIVLLNRILLHMQYGIPATSYSWAAIAAAVMSKVFLIVDAFFTLERYKGKPLIYLTLLKTVIYFLSAELLQYLEKLIGGLFRHRSLLDSTLDFWQTISQPKAVSVQISLLFLILAFVVFRELVFAVGTRKTRELFFGKKTETKPPEDRAAA